MSYWLRLMFPYMTLRHRRSQKMQSRARLRPAAGSTESPFERNCDRDRDGPRRAAQEESKPTFRYAEIALSRLILYNNNVVPAHVMRPRRAVTRGASPDRGDSPHVQRLRQHSIASRPTPTAAPAQARSCRIWNPSRPISELTPQLQRSTT